jgi:rubrerythrin
MVEVLTEDEHIQKMTHLHQKKLPKRRSYSQNYRGRIFTKYEDRLTHLIDREEELWQTGRIKWICWHCRFTSSMSWKHSSPQCPTCGYEMKRLDGRARVPRRDALESKWRRFEILFRKKGN